MKKIVSLSMMVVLAIMTYAQTNRQFTLDELIPGGTKYSTFAPRLGTQYQWYGDKLIAIQKGVFSEVDLRNPSKATTTLIDLKDFNINDKRVFNISLPKEGYIATVYIDGGMVLYDLSSRRVVREFLYPEGGENYTLSPNKKYVAFTRHNNLYILDENNNEIAVATDDNSGIVFGQSVHRNEFGINGGIFWNNDGSKLAFYRMDETMVTDYPIVDISTRIAKHKPIKYPMAGEETHRVTVGVYDVATQQTTYLKANSSTDVNNYLTNVSWNPTGTALYIAELNRAQKHMWFNQYDAVSGDFVQTLFEEQDKKYVEPQSPMVWIPNQPNQFIWQSRRDGYNHLYLYNTSGKLLKQLTNGNWEVTDIVGFDAKANHIFIASTNPTPMDRHIYQVNLRNSKANRLTVAEGMHSAMLSSSGKYLIDRYTAHNNPGTIDLVNVSSKKAQTLAQAANPYDGLSIPSVESGTIKAADNTTDLYYRMIKPADFDSNNTYPVAIYVYGGPHSQMVQNRWRYGSSGWEFYMAQQGYIVFVVDNRGTSYRGAAFEQATHRQLGVEEGKDQMKGVEYLKTLPYVDANRMGIHGWSYGGFMTINMLLRYPDTFKVGVAGGPVIDWKYYEIMYGERYMDTPQDNPEGYKESSLLNKADQLKARLLIIHGDEDPVVVMQHSLQFLKKSITAKTHPDFFVYPGHEHNMMGIDRVHLHEHITRYFNDFNK